VNVAVGTGVVVFVGVEVGSGVFVGVGVAVQTGPVQPDVGLHV
jgi:acetyltransferase-like isoleucine patch superfamily enzyme